jgi:hypothetical protein
VCIGVSVSGGHCVFLFLQIYYVKVGVRAWVRSEVRSCAGSADIRRRQIVKSAPNLPDLKKGRCPEGVSKPEGSSCDVE